MTSIPATMVAMVLERQGEPLVRREVPCPRPAAGQVLIEVKACGVCRTDLHVFDGDLSEPKLPLVLGHEIVGVVRELGPSARRFAVGQRIGVPWLGHACGSCAYCARDAENLCDRPGFTGYSLDGGYAEFTVADEAFCLAMPDEFDDAHGAPLLCAGLIGYRAYRMVGEAKHIGLYGFGAAAHILTQIARGQGQGRAIYAFTRPGDAQAQGFARELGAAWAGDSTEPAPRELDAAILFAPLGALIPIALRSVVRGGVVVCAGIHMSDVPGFPYEILWGERQLRSVANLTRRDGEEFFAAAAAAATPVRTTIERFALEDANIALQRLRAGQLRGAAVLVIGEGREGRADDHPR